MLDGRTLGAPYRGFGTYLRNLLPRLAADPSLDVSLLTQPGTEVPTGVRTVPMARRAPGRFASFEHNLRLPWDLQSLPMDVFHSPADDPPRRSHRPWVQTLHSTLPLVSSDPALLVERRRWGRYGGRLREAAMVLCVSRYCADEAVRLLALDPARVCVVYHGVAEAFRCGPAAPPPHPYLLYVGEYGPWKGYTEAFDAVGALADAGYPHVLKVAGRLAPWVRDTVEQLVADAPRPDRIELLGYVGPDALPALYAGAAALVMTSRFECFGLPIIEAMAAGAPVVAFRNTAIGEVAADAASLVADGDVGALVGALRRLLDSPATRLELADRGRDRARLFDWDRSASLHAEVYAAVGAA